ncbi:hypothetical protein LJR225_001902 [Phenylobacterium sp. LjRoot225]|uniref:hypothetical protein n=1 Tax=Phenylobacterium sp. LjRoot225 TaxID=3342285 RepID=UPI003ECF9B2C
MSDDHYETNTGGFSKARSHIMLILGLIVAAAIAMGLERLDPKACGRPATTHVGAASINPA